MPDPDSTRFGYGKKPISHRAKTTGGGGGVGGYVGNTGTLAQAQQDQAYLDMLGQALSGGQFGGGGGGGRGYVSGGGGGGYGGPSAYDQWRIAEEKRRREELEKQKRMLELALTGQKRAAGPVIAQQGREAQRNVTNVFNENKQATADITRQLQGLGANMVGGARNELAGLQRDLGAQGGGGADMRALQAAAQANITGNQFLQGNADSFNRRLAAVMGGAKADAYSAAGTVRSAGLADLENNYLQALMQIRLMGLA